MLSSYQIGLARKGISMPEIDFMALITSSMIDYGPVFLGLIMLLSPFGVPVPATPIILAAGAMVKTGTVEWSSFSIVLLVSVVLSDCISYLMGRYAGQKLTNHKRISKSGAWQKAQRQIRDNAPLAIFTSHSLITSLGLATNMLAGTSSYPFKRFLLWDFVGRVFWILIYGGIGYFLGGQSEMLEHVTGRMLPLVLIAAICVFIFYQYIRKNRTVRLDHA